MLLAVVQVAWPSQPALMVHGVQTVSAEEVQAVEAYQPTGQVEQAVHWISAESVQAAVLVVPGLQLLEQSEQTVSAKVVHDWTSNSAPEQRLQGVQVTPMPK